MRIILGGGGDRKKSEDLDVLFASLIDKSKPLLYIPIAIDTKRHPYPECLKWLQGTFDKLGITKYAMWIEKNLQDIKDEPTQFGGVYIGGGNTYYLLEILKETKFWEFLKVCASKNIPIYGSSAGAIIFGNSILTSSDENLVQFKNTSGMDILQGLSIFCHYEAEKESRVIAGMQKNHLTGVIALSERTGIYVQDGNVTIVGNDPAVLFSTKGKSVISVGEQITWKQ